MARILLSLSLILANFFCATACLANSCESKAREASPLPPCHGGMPSGDYQTPGGQDGDGSNCSHQLVSLAETASVKPAVLFANSFAYAVAPDSFVSPSLALTDVRILRFYQLPFSRPRGTSILRI